LELCLNPANVDACLAAGEITEAQAEAIRRAAVRAIATAVAAAVCKSDSEDARCKKVYKDCANKCADLYADDPDSLPGEGSDLGARVRLCIAECVKAAGCSPYQGK
jgi:hypothetical protein